MDNRQNHSPLRVSRPHYLPDRTPHLFCMEESPIRVAAAVNIHLGDKLSHPPLTLQCPQRFLFDIATNEHLQAAPIGYPWFDVLTSHSPFAQAVADFLPNNCFHQADRPVIGASDATMFSWHSQTLPWLYFGNIPKFDHLGIAPTSRHRLSKGYGKI